MPDNKVITMRFRASAEEGLLLPTGQIYTLSNYFYSLNYRIIDNQYLIKKGI